MPIRPSWPSFSTISYGKRFSRSSSSATGLTSPSANSRTRRRMASCSSVRSKSIGAVMVSGACFIPAWRGESAGNADHHLQRHRGSPRPRRPRRADSGPHDAPAGTDRAGRPSAGAGVPGPAHRNAASGVGASFPCRHRGRDAGSGRGGRDDRRRDLPGRALAQSSRAETPAAIASATWLTLVVTCDHMRARIGIRELRDTLTTTIRRVRQGETLEITHDGVPVAILAPLPADRAQQLVASGEATAPTELVEPLQRYPVTGTVTAGEAIEDDRAEHRERGSAKGDRAAVASVPPRGGQRPRAARRGRAHVTRGDDASRNPPRDGALRGAGGANRLRPALADGVGGSGGHGRRARAGLTGSADAIRYVSCHGRTRSNAALAANTSASA